MGYDLGMFTWSVLAQGGDVWMLFCSNSNPVLKLLLTVCVRRQGAIDPLVARRAVLRGESVDSHSELRLAQFGFRWRIHARPIRLTTPSLLSPQPPGMQITLQGANPADSDAV